MRNSKSSSSSSNSDSYPLLPGLGAEDWGWSGVMR